MVMCSECQASVNETAKVCPNCGYPLDLVEDRPAVLRSGEPNSAYTSDSAPARPPVGVAPQNAESTSTQQEFTIGIPIFFAISLICGLGGGLIAVQSGETVLVQAAGVLGIILGIVAIVRLGPYALAWDKQQRKDERRRKSGLREAILSARHTTGRSSPSTLLLSLGRYLGASVVTALLLLLTPAPFKFWTWASVTMILPALVIFVLWPAARASGFIGKSFRESDEKVQSFKQALLAGASQMVAVGVLCGVYAYFSHGTPDTRPNQSVKARRRMTLEEQKWLYRKLPHSKGLTDRIIAKQISENTSQYWVNTVFRFDKFNSDDAWVQGTVRETVDRMRSEVQAFTQASVVTPSVAASGGVDSELVQMVQRHVKILEMMIQGIDKNYVGVSPEALSVPVEKAINAMNDIPVEDFAPESLQIMQDLVRIRNEDAAMQSTMQQRYGGLAFPLAREVATDAGRASATGAQ